MKKQSLSNRAVQGLRLACVSIGVAMIVFGIYCAFHPALFHRASEQATGKLALVVSCETEEELAALIETGARLTVAIPLEAQGAETLASTALKNGMEVVVKYTEATGTFAASTEEEAANQAGLVLAGARGYLVEDFSRTGLSAAMVADSYIISRAPANGVLLPDYVLNGQSEPGCCETLAEVGEQLSAGRQVMAVYESGQEMPIGEVVARLGKDNVVFVSRLLE